MHGYSRQRSSVDRFIIIGVIAMGGILGAVAAFAMSLHAGGS